MLIRGKRFFHIPPDEPIQFMSLQFWTSGRLDKGYFMLAKGTFEITMMKTLYHMDVEPQFFINFPGGSANGGLSFINTSTG